MKLSWVMADSMAHEPMLDIEKIKNIGSIWGGWRTWRSCETDNVVCHELSNAQQLTTKGFHNRCNLHIPSAIYQQVNRPPGVKLYQGEFCFDVDHPDEIVSIHLAAQNSNIVILLGFDLSEKDVTNWGKLEQHNWHVYKNFIRQIINDKPDVQWVLLNQKAKLDKTLAGLKNLQLDTLENILGS